MRCCRGHRQAHTHKQKPAGSFSVPPDSNTPVLEQTEIRLKSGKRRRPLQACMSVSERGFETVLHSPLPSRARAWYPCLPSSLPSFPSHGPGEKDKTLALKELSLTGEVDT